MREPYYADESVTLYHGDCREVTEWLSADVLVFDPPYGRAWKQGQLKGPGQKSDKPPNAGTRGALGGRRRDAEAIYMLGPWPSGLGGATSILTTGARSQGNPSSPQGRYGHPHAKPLDLMAELIGMCPPGVVADPCAGGGSTLAAAKTLGRRAIGVELDESYCEKAAKRLSVPDLFGQAS